MAVVKQAGVVGAQRYVTALHDAMAGHPTAAFVTYYTVQEIQSRGMTPILQDGAGVLVWNHGDGRIEAGGLFSTGGGAGMALLKQVIAQYHVNYVEAFEPLNKMYEELGFHTQNQDAWDDKYAPSSWNYAAHGTPSVHYMVR
jgi:hypothetical protein